MNSVNYDDINTDIIDEEIHDYNIKISRRNSVDIHSVCHISTDNLLNY